MERIRRWENGEKLNDLFAPMLEDKKGDIPEIELRDILGDVSQMSMPPTRTRALRDQIE